MVSLVATAAATVIVVVATKAPTLLIDKIPAVKASDSSRVHSGTVVKYVPSEDELFFRCMSVKKCLILAEVGYYEARNQKDDRHVAAVMWVALNRVNSPRFKEESLKNVVYKPFQFSYTHDGSMKKGISEPRAYRRVALIAKKVLLGEIPDVTGGSDHYHTTQVKPNWDFSKLQKTGRQGDHVFYRYKEG